MVKMTGECPVCRGALVVKSLFCPRCNVKMEGDFALPEILSLSQEQLEFVTVFLRARGNIREVERELGISYPTVRSKLEDVISRLGFEPEPVTLPPATDVLASLERGDISVDEALKRLKGEASS
jgi:hypothetical protein